MDLLDLQAKLKKEFPDVAIGKLKDLAKKIAVIAKVRVGKERSVLDYSEVTLADADAYGIIRVDPTKEKPAAANSSAIRSQSLHKNDILVSYRGVDIQVGRIDREYEKPVVSNNSAIRIQFDYEDKDIEEEVSIFVQSYLQLPYVKEYIASRPQSSQNDRKILSPLFLSNLPIPLFQAKGYAIKELMHTRFSLLRQADELCDTLQHILAQLQEHKERSLHIALEQTENIQDEKNQDEKIAQDLVQIATSLQRLQSLLGE